MIFILIFFFTKSFGIVGIVSEYIVSELAQREVKLFRGDEKGGKLWMCVSAWP